MCVCVVCAHVARLLTCTLDMMETGTTASPHRRDFFPQWTYTLCVTVAAALCVSTTFGGAEANTSEISAEAKQTEYCDRETFEADCGKKGVVVMDYARYGRMSLGKCIKTNYGHLGCEKDVLEHMDAKCSGRNRCHIRDVVDELHVHNPCDDSDLKVFLQASFHCVTVSPPRELCTPERVAQISHDGTSLASRSLQHPNCLSDSDENIFYLNALPGQQLNISLVDFSTKGLGNKHYCAEYGEITDEQTKQSTPICGGSHREKWLTVSNSHKIRVKLFKSAIEEENFIVKLKALGCPDLQPPPQAKVERQGSKVYIVCDKATRPAWELTCEDNTWVGVVGNCSTKDALTAVETDENALLPTDVTVALIAAVATVACLTIITIGIILWKRYTVDNRIKRMQAAQRIKVVTDPTTLPPRPRKPRPERPVSRPASRPDNSRPGSDYMSPIYLPSNNQTDGENAIYDFCFASTGFQPEKSFQDKALPSIPNIPNEPTSIMVEDATLPVRGHGIDNSSNNKQNDLNTTALYATPTKKKDRKPPPSIPTVPKSTPPV